MDIQGIKQRFGIIGNAPGLNRAIEVAVQVAPTDLSVLITGESGTGKEMFPQIIHQFSVRKHGKYIAVNCGAIPEGTIDSELFGHEKGSFTGALADRKGYFEEADGGTIFLDEIGELPLATQVRLLRVLETGEFIKVGSSRMLKTNVRVIAATNVNLPDAIQQGKFREDLYYRLNTVPITVPPLRHRADDIYLLFRKFAGDFADKYRMPPIRLDEEGRQLLGSFGWPGNVRQLKNITEQISIIEQNRDISANILKTYLPASATNLPAIFRSSEEKTFGSEREILYQVLFDMKRDMNDLKKLVLDLMHERDGIPVDDDHSHTIRKLYQNEMGHDPRAQAGSGSMFQSWRISSDPAKAKKFAEETVELVNEKKTVNPIQMETINKDDILDTEVFIEESLSLADKEIELIRKALEKHHGKRKLAAQELGISERTLYRKIKEYDIEG